MSEKLWVEYKTDKKTSISKVSIKGCKDVDDFIEKIKSHTQFSSIKNSEITLHRPSGAAIEVDEPISSLLPGNSSKNPHHVQVSAGTDPASTAMLTLFWDSLRGIEPENGFLKFHIMPPFFPDGFKALYVRKAYGDLFEIICKKQFRGMAITGTPGIGKSMFLFYILWRLANMGVKGAVILHRRADLGLIYVFQKDGGWIALDRKDILLFLIEPSTWYLTDSLLLPVGGAKAITIVVSSPAEKYYSKFLECSHVAPLHYLPIWSLDELKLVAPLYNKSEDVVKERFRLIGGLPRFVLETNVNLDAMIDAKIGKMLSKKPMAIPSAETAGENKLSHRLMHFKVEPPCYTEYKLVIASEYVRKKYSEAFDYQEEQELRHQLSLHKDIPPRASSVGDSFQHYVNRHLSAGGEFSMRSLDGRFEEKMLFRPKESQRFKEFSECTNPGIYYIPLAKNFSCIDSLIVGVGYFQITISRKHDINWEKMKKIKDFMKMNALYFVVPYTNFEEFKKQIIVGAPKREKSASSTLDERSKPRISEGVDDANKENEAQLMGANDEGNSEEDLVKQFVIGVPIDDERRGWIRQVESGS